MSKGENLEEEYHNRVDDPPQPIPNDLDDVSLLELAETLFNGKTSLLDADADDVGMPQQNDPMEVGAGRYPPPYARTDRMGTPSPTGTPGGHFTTIPRCSSEEGDDQKPAAVLSANEDMEWESDSAPEDNEEKETDPDYEDQETDRKSDLAQETDPESNEKQETGNHVMEALPVAPGMYKDVDVLMGRGGRSNQHHGNRLYLADRDELRKLYVKTKEKAQKTLLSKELVGRVRARGGRFMADNKKTKKWKEVEFSVARKKASQCLRDDSSPESRRLKRLKYGNPKK